MSNELMLAVAGAIGVGAGYAYATVRALEQRCEVLDMARDDVLSAIGDLNTVLGDETAPREVKQLAVYLLAGYAHDSLGEEIIRRVASEDDTSDEELENNPIEQALNAWGEVNPHWERRARKAFAVLTMGLAILHLGNQVQLMKVERRAVRDPLWTRVGVPQLDSQSALQAAHIQ